MAWEHMSTAPRDGTRILVARTRQRSGPALVKKVVIAAWNGQHWSLEIGPTRYLAHDDKLFGWMPLPEYIEEDSL